MFATQYWRAWTAHTATWATTTLQEQFRPPGRPWPNLRQCAYMPFTSPMFFVFFFIWFAVSMRLTRRANSFLLFTSILFCSAFWLPTRWMEQFQRHGYRRHNILEIRPATRSCCIWAKINSVAAFPLGRPTGPLLLCPLCCTYPCKHLLCWTCRADLSDWPDILQWCVQQQLDRLPAFGLGFLHSNFVRSYSLNCPFASCLHFLTWTFWLTCSKMPVMQVSILLRAPSLPMVLPSWICTDCHLAVPSYMFVH